MKTLKTILKWLAILVVSLFALGFLEGQSDLARLGVGLAIFFAFLAYQLNKRLEVIEEHLIKIRVRMGEE